MIGSQREYETRQAFVKGMEQAVADADHDLAGQHPLLAAAMRQGQCSLLEEAREEVAEYEALRDGRLQRVRLAALPELGGQLQRARLAAGLTRAMLARRLGWTAEQVAFYESTDYRAAPLAHCQAVLDALTVKLSIEALIGTPPASATEEREASSPAAATITG